MSDLFIYSNTCLNIISFCSFERVGLPMVKRCVFEACQSIGEHHFQGVKSYFIDHGWMEEEKNESWNIFWF